MTLTEAGKLIGETVYYRPRLGFPAEAGVIVRINGQFVFVRYGNGTPKATRPADLHLTPEGR